MPKIPPSQIFTNSITIQHYLLTSYNQKKKERKRSLWTFAFMSSNLENLTSLGCCSIKKKQDRKLEKVYQENTIK